MFGGTHGCKACETMGYLTAMGSVRYSGHSKACRERMLPSRDVDTTMGQVRQAVERELPGGKAALKHKGYLAQGASCATRILLQSFC